MHEAGYLKDHPDAAPGRPRRPGLAAARRLAGRLPDPSRLPPVPDGRVPPGPPGRSDRRHLARLSPRPCELGTGPAEPPRHLFLRPLPVAVRPRDRQSTCRTPRRPSGPARLLGAGQAGLGPMAMRRVHRLGPRVPRDPRPGTPRRAARDVPLPLVGIRARRRPAQKLAIDLKAQATYLDVSQHHALPRPVRPCERSGLDLATDRRAGTIPRASRASPANGSGSGRSCSSRTGARRSRRPRSGRSSTTARGPGDRRDGFRLGHAAPPLGEGRSDGRSPSGPSAPAADRRGEPRASHEAGVCPSLQPKLGGQRPDTVSTDLSATYSPARRLDPQSHSAALTCNQTVA